jgi:hypothetical protein
VLSSIALCLEVVSGGSHQACLLPALATQPPAPSSARQAWFSPGAVPLAGSHRLHPRVRPPPEFLSQLALLWFSCLARNKVCFRHGESATDGQRWSCGTVIAKSGRISSARYHHGGGQRPPTMTATRERLEVQGRHDVPFGPSPFSTARPPAIVVVLPESAPTWSW